MESVEAPIAYYYELASHIRDDGTYTSFTKCLTFSKPNVPEGSIRNLKPLYSKEQLNALPSQPPI